MTVTTTIDPVGIPLAPHEQLDLQARIVKELGVESASWHTADDALAALARYRHISANFKPGEFEKHKEDFYGTSARLLDGSQVYIWERDHDGRRATNYAVVDSRGVPIHYSSIMTEKTGLSAMERMTNGVSTVDF